MKVLFWLQYTYRHAIIVTIYLSRAWRECVCGSQSGCWQLSIAQVPSYNITPLSRQNLPTNMTPMSFILAPGTTTHNLGSQPQQQLVHEVEAAQALLYSRSYHMYVRRLCPPKCNQKRFVGRKTINTSCRPLFNRVHALECQVSWGDTNREVVGY